VLGGDGLYVVRAEGFDELAAFIDGF